MAVGRTTNNFEMQTNQSVVLENICGSLWDVEKNLATKGCGLSFNSTSDKNKVFKCQQLRPDFKNSPEWVLPRYVGYNRRVNCFTDGENSTEIVLNPFVIFQILT